MDEIVVHVKFEGGTDEPEIFRVPAETVWMDLECMLKAQFDCEDIKVFYIDPDGDYVVMGSQEELFEAFRVAYSCDKTLHVVVRDLGPDTILFREDDTPVTPAPAVASTGSNTAAPLVDPSGTSVDAVIKIEMLEPVKETTVIVDKATGEVTAEVTEKSHADRVQEEVAAEENPAENEEPVLREPPEMMIRVNETQEDEGIVIDKNVIENQPRRQERERRQFAFSVDRGARYRRTKAAFDQESGEEVAMPYSVFVKYMHQLKQELRTEIVKDVTKKTVRHVLKGLDGAVIQSVQGTPAGTAPTGNEPGITSPLAAAGENTNAVDPTSSHPIYYHESVVCDFCERVIVGARYKCCNCVDYDLCEECEAIHGVHDWDHVFLKIRKPVKIRRSTPLLKHTLYKSLAQPLELQAEPPQNPNIQVETFLKSKVAKIQEKTLRKQERLKRKEEKLLHKQKKKEEILKRRMEGQGEKPLKKERLDFHSKTLMTMNSSLLYDVTIPDGTCVQPGTKLIKTWRMKNNGAFAWDNSTKLHHVFGLLPVNKEVDVDVPHIKPDDECDVSVELEAPEKPGKYQSHWKMTHKGKEFGYRVWCEIYVEPRLLLEPTKDNLLQMVDVENNDHALVRPEQEVVVMTQPMSEVKINMDEELTPEKTVIKSESQQTHVTVNSEDVKSDIQIQEDIEKPEAEDRTDELEVINTDKLHQDLNTAAAAVAQLKLDQEQPDTKTTGQDLMTFELLDIGTRATPKVSQTATPNNTPLDVSPPPEMEDFKVLSQSSSVEVVNNSPEEEVDPASDYVQDILSSLPGPKPNTEEADIESLKSYTDDSMSLSEDDDFLMVPMPACFDFSKPISRSILEQLSDDDDDDDEDEEVDDNHNRITNTDNRGVDDILTTSRDTSTPVLEPQPAEDNSSPSEQIPAEEVQESTAVSQADNVTTAAEVAPQSVSIATSAAGAASCNDEVPQNIETGESSGTDEGQAEATVVKEPITEEVHSAEGGVSGEEPAQSSDDHGATGHSQRGGNDHKPAEIFVNQMVNTAVKAANKAAANAYTTCKEVFYTWQARAYHPPNKQYKPPQQNWVPKGDKYVPPTSQWKPKQEKWVPPPQSTVVKEQVTVTTKKDTGPMAKLFEMGFCNREKNLQLLQKHDNDVEKVIQELLVSSDNDWMAGRH